MIPILFGISLLIFFIMFMSPADPALVVLGENATFEARTLLHEQMGLNRPFFVQYFEYIGRALRGDLGNSYVSNEPVLNEIMVRFPNTLRLATFSWIISIIIGVPIGILSAVKRYSTVDIISLVFAMIFASTPLFVTGLIFLLFFSLNLHWFPSMASASLRSYVLPAVTLSFNWLASSIRMTRFSMLEIIRQDYVRTARVKGASETRVIFKHILQNAMLPIITVLGMNFAVMLAGSAVIETVFSVPGMGRMLVDAVNRHDTPIVMGIVLLTAALIGIINLLIDILYGFIDPRVKTLATSGRWGFGNLIKKHLIPNKIKG
jgi:peptide/nickel transport system permease protein